MKRSLARSEQSGAANRVVVADGIVESVGSHGSGRPDTAAVSTSTQ